MAIEGVISLETRTIKSFRIKLDHSLTNGHDFCELIVDEAQNNFTARLYGGEVYTYGWGSPGDDFIAFLINVFEELDNYLYDKIANHSLSEFTDMEATTLAMKIKVLQARRNQMIDEELARTAFDEVNSLHSYDDTHTTHFYDLYLSNISKEAQNELFCGDEPWFSDFHVPKSDWKATVFCEKVAPILAKVLRKEYAR